MSTHDSIIARFKERFILSLGSCSDCLVLGDELGKGGEHPELKALKDTLVDMRPVVKLAKMLNQSQAILIFMDASDHSCPCT